MVHALRWLSRRIRRLSSSTRVACSLRSAAAWIRGLARNLSGGCEADLRFMVVCGTWFMHAEARSWIMACCWWAMAPTTAWTTGRHELSGCWPELRALRQVKNSWGASWGEDGYIRLKRGVPKDGECGIKDQPLVCCSQVQRHYVLPIFSPTCGGLQRCNSNIINELIITHTNV